MSKEIDIHDLKNSPIYSYGPIVSMWCLRVAMAGCIAAIFMSPVAVKPKSASAACTCVQDPAGATTCTPPASNPNEACGGNPPGANAPEMPALLVPLFLAVGGGVAYRVRKKALAKA